MIQLIHFSIGLLVVMLCFGTEAGSLYAGWFIDESPGYITALKAGNVRLPDIALDRDLELCPVRTGNTGYAPLGPVVLTVERGRTTARLSAFSGVVPFLLSFWHWQTAMWIIVLILVYKYKEVISEQLSKLSRQKEGTESTTPAQD